MMSVLLFFCAAAGGGGGGAGGGGGGGGGGVSMDRSRLGLLEEGETLIESIKQNIERTEGWLSEDRAKLDQM